MKRYQQASKVDLANRLSNTLKDQFVRMNFAVLALDPKDNEHNYMYDELNDAFYELLYFYNEFPECFDECETELMEQFNEIVCAVCEADGITDEQADAMSDIQIALYNYYMEIED